MPVQVTLSPQWRDLAGRFARKPIDGAVDAALPDLARTLVMRLQDATPVRTGRMRTGWRQSYFPGRKAVVITDEAPYAPYVVFGTSGRPANPQLQAVLSGAAGDLSVTAEKMGREIVTKLAGSP